MFALTATSKKCTAPLMVAVVLLCTCSISVQAQGTDGTAAAGQEGSAYSNGTTGFQAGQAAPVSGNPIEAPRGFTYRTGSQSSGKLPSIGGGVPGGPGTTYGLNGTGYAPGSLPPTTLDSFVYNSGYADTIYGDEGDYGPPPYWDFSTIGSGINSGGLSTGHAGSLPSSWGYTSSSY